MITLFTIQYIKKLTKTVFKQKKQDILYTTITCGVHSLMEGEIITQTQ